MAAQQQLESLIPDHLRPFLRPIPPPAAKSASTYHYVPSDCELCPPRWRHRPLRKRVKELFDTTHPHPKPDMRSRHSIRDTGDYLTARAANPRTGLISPSIPPSPPQTPDSPGEALRLVATGDGPCYRSCSRAPLTMAYQRQLAEIHFPEHSIGPGKNSPSSSLHPDQFVVKMPTAEEPQPYLYPGKTTEQIRAYELYKDKTRKVSNEGYGNPRRAGLEEQREQSTNARSSGITISHVASFPTATVAKGKVQVMMNHRVKPCIFTPMPSEAAKARRDPRAVDHSTSNTDQPCTDPLASAPDLTQGNHVILPETASTLHRQEDATLGETRPPSRRNCSLGCATIVTSNSRGKGDRTLCVRLGVQRNKLESRLLDPDPARADSSQRTHTTITKADVDLVLGAFLALIENVVRLDVTAILDSGTQSTKPGDVKAWLTAACRALAVVVVIAIVWRVAMLVRMALAIVLWPFMVLWRVFAVLGTLLRS